MYSSTGGAHSPLTLAPDEVRLARRRSLLTRCGLLVLAAAMVSGCGDDDGSAAGGFQLVSGQQQEGGGGALAEAPVGGSSTTGGGGAAAAGGSGASWCQQKDAESNDSIWSCQQLSDANDCNLNASAIQGTLLDYDDDEWFRIHVDDEQCALNPKFTNMSFVPMTMCMFYSCDSGVAELTCKAGDVLYESNGMPGCCTSSQVLGPKTLNCKNTVNDSGTVFLWATADAPLECEHYTIGYHF